ncbi:MAG TPA: NAD(FAD)-dependent dehydrogenase [Thermoplasmatales archaeon]|nr:NAD(FAD)-dependent dehydrogenase [Thermoplasmatales archaeon]HEX17096.1 NAD(FAD)-dependent dehydrogenase [Thermoplasmatales archaeon]
MTRRIVVIGGGASGSTSAQFARKTDRSAEVTIFEREKYPQYSRCALPYLISGKVKDVIEFSEEWFRRNGIDLYLETEVKDIDMQKKVVVAERKGESIEKRFDTLVMATGARPGIPPIDGVYDGERLKRGVFTLRTLDDAIAIKNYSKSIDRVLVVGAGLIGLEVSEALYELGKEIVVVEILPSILPGMIDQDMAEIVHRMIKEKIDVMLRHKVKRIEGRDGVEKVIVEGEDGKEKEIDVQMVILATGIKANVDLARRIGCKLGDTGAIVVDRRCMTSIKDVYAVGDCTEYRDLVTGKPFPVGLGSIGVRQGMVAGINSAGGSMELPEGLLQTRTTRIFGVEISAVGPLSKEIDGAIQGKYRGRTLPHYFPGGEEIIVKTIIKSSGEIASAQIIGNGGALRINTFACAIYKRMKIDEFSKLETSYAPPVAPVLDPMIISADMARYRYERGR